MTKHITSIWDWFRKLISGRPHMCIGGAERPYLRRWYLIPRNRWFNVYLHQFLRDDDDRALHDHPWWFISVMLRGAYMEHLEDGRIIGRYAPSIAIRPALHRHRVQLFPTGGPWSPRRPCWTLVITGRKYREWGFWCPKGFVPWFQFIDQSDEGRVGPGCGD